MPTARSRSSPRRMRGGYRPILPGRPGNRGASLLCGRARMQAPRAVVARDRPGLVRRLRDGRPLRFSHRVRSRNRWLLVFMCRFGMMHRLGSSVHFRCRFGCTRRVVMRTGMMRGTRMIMAPMRRTDSGTMTGRITRWARHPVNVRRIMPMPAVPRCRPPGGHQASRRQRSKREYRNTCRRIPIHRLTIIIAKYRETICIIARIRPAYGRTPARPTHTHRSAGIHGIRIRCARTKQNRGRY